jgi:rhodanese-related sulfurtransferase/thiol-disulfide isomerase/thioredoxin
MTEQLPREVYEAIQGKAFDLIDVRTPAEFAAVHAVGARLVPLDDLDPAAVLATRRGQPGDPIYLICHSGARSGMAAALFRKAGFEQVVNVIGGTAAWSSAGLPVERDARAARSAAMRRFVPMLVAAAAILFLAPCSPWSVWGSAYCPVTPAPAAPAPAPASTPAPAPAPAGFDFARDVIEASRARPIVVDYHATWCPPCRMLGPELEAVAARRTDLSLVKIDVDEHPSVAREQGVEGIPDVRLWNGGREVGRFVGYRGQQDILAWIDGALTP